MAPKNTKTNTVAKAETKTTKATPVKAEEAKVEAVKTEVKEEAKVEVKAAPAKKTATKATAEKKTTAKAATKADTKKTAEKKETEKKTELFVQFSGLEFSTEDLIEKVKADYIAQTGKKTISSTKLYLKPEDMTVYYVVNEKFLGSVYLG